MARLRSSMVSVAMLSLPPLLFPCHSAAATPEILYRFIGGEDGSNPAGVIAGSAGVLYGTTCNGGTSDSGAVYSLTAPQGDSSSPWTKSTLYSFTGTSDGACPNALVLGAGGVLYGTTAVANQTTSQTAFSLTPPQSSGPWMFTLLYNFTLPSYEGGPIAVATGPNGVLYLTTRFGGTAEVGSVESLTPPAAPPGPWTLTVLHSFTGHTEFGAFPMSGVIVGPGGELYGTAQSGGLTGCPTCGIVYALFPPQSPGGNWPFKILYSFTIEENEPVGITMGKGGVLYGTLDTGAVFSLTPPATPGGAWTEAILYTFSNTSSNDQCYPLVIGPVGVLYGIAALECCGIIYSLTPPDNGSTGGWTETTMYDFANVPFDGGEPGSALIFGKGGTLFGTTYNGGTSDLGAIYALKP